MEKEKEKEFSASWAGGEFRPSERGRGQAAQPTHGGAGRRGRTPWVRAHASARGGGRTGRARPPVRSTVVLRREPNFATEEWWRGTGGVGDLGVAPIWSEGAWGGRSTARWRALVAVRSPARLPSAIGGGRWVHCVCEGMAKLKNYMN
jgi:hypothetical protein